MVGLKKLKIKGKRPSASIFALIICINICSILIQSLFNYYAFHRMNRDAYLENFISYNSGILNLAFQNIDEQIMMPAYKFAPYHFVSGGTDNPLTLPQEKNIKRSAKETKALVTELRNLARMYPYIASIDVYYEATGTAVTGIDKVHFLADQEERDRYLPWYGIYERQGRPSGFVINPDGAYLVENPVLTYFQTISELRWGGKGIVLAVFINPEGIQRYISREMGEFLILTPDGQVLYNSGQQKMRLLNQETIDSLRKEMADGGHDPIRLQGSSALVFPFLSEESGLTYLYAVENSYFYRDYEATGSMFFTNYLISIGFNLLLLAVISYYNYAVYRKRVLNVSKKAGIAIDSSNKSFDRSLCALTGEITSLNAKLQSSEGLRFQTAVRSVILNRNIEEGYRKIEPYLTKDSVQTFLMYLEDKDMEKLSLELLQAEFPSGLYEYNVIFTTIDKDGLVAVVIFNQGDRKQISEEFMGSMRVRWKKAVMVSGMVCSSKGDGVRSSYRSAVDISKYHFIFPDETYLSWERIDKENRKASGSHLKLFEEIRKDINGENPADLRYHIETLVVSFQTGNYMVEYCVSTLGDLVSLLYQVMQQHHLDMWVVFGYDIREYYKQIPDIRTFYEWCNGIAETVLKNIHQNKSSIGGDIRTKILEIVENNLENDNMSLEFLADQLHVRVDVASRMFQQVMGTGYGKYMKERRMNRAIELMAEGMAVKDVTRRLGYSSSQYFIRIFKETYGITPYQYYKQHEQKRDSGKDTK